MPEDLELKCEDDDQFLSKQTSTLGQLHQRSIIINIIFYLFILYIYSTPSLNKHISIINYYYSVYESCALTLVLTRVKLSRPIVIIIILPPIKQSKYVNMTILTV